MKIPYPTARPPIDRELSQAIASRRGLGAGSWTDIQEFTLPGQANPGDTVPVQLRVSNLGTFSFYVAATCTVNGQEVLLTPEYAGVDPAGSQLFEGSHVMPEQDAQVTVYSFYWTGEEWYLDDQETLVCLLPSEAALFSNLRVSYKRSY